MAGSRRFRTRVLAVVSFLAVVWFLALAAAKPASADTVQVNDTFDGNDCSGAFGQGFANCKIPAGIDPDQSPIIIKFNTPGAVEINSGLFPSITGSEFTLTLDGEGQTGTWTYAPGPGDPGITFWVAKGGPDFNLFTDDSGLPVTTGTWFTPLNPGGNQAGLSHIDFYDTAGTPVPPDQVPAPGALVLLATGLVGVAALGRKVLGRR
jgi:hypothetical protein